MATKRKNPEDFKFKKPWGWVEEDYEMLRVLFAQGLSNDEIAQAMGRTVNTVATALRRCQLNRGAGSCLTCGEALAKQEHGRPRRYCSEKCGRQYRDSNVRTEQELAFAEIVESPTPKTCEGCGIEMSPEVIRRRLNKGLSPDWCSGTCRQSARLFSAQTSATAVSSSDATSREITFSE